MFKILGAALVAAVTFGAAASAATLNGTFNVTAVNVSGVNSAQSEASLANFNAALAGSLGTLNGFDDFVYTGDLFFGTSNSNNSTTIAQWLATGTSGGVSGLDGIGGLTQSTPNINNGSATTTFFLFTLNTAFPGADFNVRHDDGFAVYSGTTRIGGVLGPTQVLNSTVTGFGGGPLSFLYVATNGDPSIFEVSAVNVVPVPAALPLLLAGLGGLALLRRRKAA